VSEPFRLVLAFDATPAALQAARFVAAHQGAATDVLALIVPPREALADQARQELGLARSILEKKQADYLVQPGFPPEVIVAEARDRAAHCIVAGTRARGGVMGLGSVASEMLRGSEFPVILVRKTRASRRRSAAARAWWSRATARTKRCARRRRYRRGAAGSEKSKRT
jgi:nucleotide-binding universal stress UspA family protein